MDTISRREALALGRKRFYTGKLCKYQHDSERYVTTGACIACLHPKIPEALQPEPLQEHVLPNKRVVTIISQDEARNRGWRVFFTGVPCSEGHLAERNVTCGRCIECLHPRKYGPDASTGWWPFQPQPPLRIPPGTPQTFRAKLAEKLQAAIPSLVKEIEAELGQTVPALVNETHVIHGILHKHVGQIWCEYKLWWPFTSALREVEEIEPLVQAADIPWVEKEGSWFGVDPTTRSLIPVLAKPKRYDPEEGQRRSQAAFLAVAVPSEPSEAAQARVREEQRRIMKE